MACNSSHATVMVANCLVNKSIRVCLSSRSCSKADNFDVLSELSKLSELLPTHGRHIGFVVVGDHVGMILVVLSQRFGIGGDAYLSVLGALALQPCVAEDGSELLSHRFEFSNDLGVGGMDVVTALETVKKGPGDRPVEDQKIIGIQTA